MANPVVITELQIENFMRVRAVALKVGKDGIILGGKNEQGKTTIIDAIWVALGGARALKKNPVHTGADEGRIELKLSNGLKVVRVIRVDRTTALEVTAADGVVIKSPQGILDMLIGLIAFDPMQFINMEGKKRLSLLSELVGLDFTEHDARYQRLYDERTAAGREHRRLEGVANGLPFIPNIPDQELSVLEFQSKLDKINSARVAKATKQGEAGRSLDNANSYKERAESVRAQIEMLQKQLAGFTENEAVHRAAAVKAEAEAKAIVIEDETPIKEEIQRLERVNEKVRNNKRRLDAIATAEEQDGVVKELTGRLEELDAEKKKLISQAKFPIEGMGFGDNDVTYKGYELNQASGAERLRVSMAVGIATARDLKFMPLRDASLLDEENLKVVLEVCAENGIQPWIERVGSGPEVMVVIEDGVIKEVRE